MFQGQYSGCCGSGGQAFPGTSRSRGCRRQKRGKDGITVEEEARARLKEAETIVVKIGTSTLTHANGNLNLIFIERLVREIADLKNQGKKMLLVSSGAIGAGMGRLGLDRKPKTIPEKQALAAIGQGILIHVYEKIFAEYGQIAAQILLTRDDLFFRKRYVNSCNTLISLLKCGAIPIINENDTVAVEEIEFGDNDNLSVLVAGLVNADLLINLSDIDGLYTTDPNCNPSAELITYVEEITPAIEGLAAASGGHLGTGGMATKINAAKIAINSGFSLVIANGRKPGIIADILAGKRVGTLFPPRSRTLHGRKKWIAFASTIQGRLIIDRGAEAAIRDDGKSLLPSGIIKAEGDFEKGDTVSIVDLDGQELARGIANYSSKEIETIKGLKTKDIERLLGKCDSEAVHRDNLVVL
ncbi:MAG TPA: glutamate 5-kinase [Firmicutes bacterium]|nr:glutamate 5-kinase [Bacillota bacterium]